MALFVLSEPAMEPERYDCIVVGAGPGGLVSAIYLKRFRRRVLVVAGGRPRAQRAPLIRNLVGYDRGISGRALLGRLRRQLRSGVDIVEGEAEVTRSGSGFRVLVGDRLFQAPSVILATGVSDQEPPLTNRESLTRRELLAYCPICDGYEQSNKRIAVLVRDTHCFGKLDFLRQYSNRLVLVKTEPFTISEKAVPHLEGVEVFEGLRWARPYKNGLRLGVGQDREIFVHIAYAELGTRVNESAIRGLDSLARTDDGFFQVDRHQETSISGLFAVGDCVHGLSQISVAVGHAAIAATAVHNRLRAPANQKRRVRTTAGLRDRPRLDGVHRA